MGRRIIKILAVLVVVVVLAVPGTALLVDDDALTSVLEGLPVAGDRTDDIVAAKRDIAGTLAAWGEDTMAGFESIYLDVLGFSGPQRTPRVVVELPQAPGPVNPPLVTPPAALSAPESATGPAPETVPETGWAVRPPSPPPPPSAAPGAAPPPMPPAVGEKAEPPAAAEAAQLSALAARDAAPPAAEKTPPPAGDTGAEQDHKRGLLFYKGVGVAKDFKKAAQWFRRAAKKGHAAAQYNLGIMSYLGQGMPQDYAKAALWFQKAGEQDHAAAQYNLGFLYYEGKGVGKDNLQAYMWIDRSANLGDEKAIRARETLQKALPKEIFAQ